MHKKTPFQFDKFMATLRCISSVLFKAVSSLLIYYICWGIPSLIIGLFLSEYLSIPSIIRYCCILLPPALVVCLNIFPSKKSVIKYWCIVSALFIIVVGINIAFIRYDRSTILDTAPAINVREYLPFQENSKIVSLDEPASLVLTDDLPIVDGASAAFPVYSAFVNAVYPDTTKLYDNVFQYNSTNYGYKYLGEKKSDIFFGAYPSQEQIDYAAANDTSFIYTSIGMDAFVFFVSKDNPVDNLTSEQIQKIYSGEITNWKEVGGNNEKIFPYQRDQGSGSQSMMIRFMDGTELMEPSKELVSDGMLEITTQVSDYRNKPGSIGFSFRFYMEAIVQNPDLKLLSVDGVPPTAENIQNGTYPIITNLYAVTWEGNDNENVALLLDWILSEQGQELILKTGYVPLP